jgi:predicted DNA-binding transcriptional regulator YafY
VENIILKATNKDRYYRFKSNRIHHSCEFNDESYEIHFKVKINPELINFIMEHIDEVEVIEPVSLRDELSKKLNNISQSYKTNL